MEYLPVGKRTRSQRAKMLIEQNKRARLAAKREWRKKKEGFFERGSGKKDENLRVLEDDYDDDDGNEPVLIDEEEFLNGVKFSDSEEKSEIGIVKKEVFDFCESEKKSEFEEMGIVKKEVFDFSESVKESEIEEMGIVKKKVSDYNQQENLLKFDEKGKGMMRDDVNGDESDGSLQILGERWNPLGLNDDSFDDDDDDDGEDVHDDGCHHPLTVEISSDDDDGEMKGDEVKKGGNFEENDDVLVSEESSIFEEDDNFDWDKDFEGEEDESSDSSGEHSSSDCSAEEVDEKGLHPDDNDVLVVDDDDSDDDEVDEATHRKIREKNVEGEVRHKKLIREKVYDDDEVEGEGVSSNEKQDDHEVRRSEKRERMSIEKEEEEEEVEKVKRQESGEKRKRGRPPKNKKAVKFESPPSRNRVRKSSKDNELQNTILDTILEVGNKGLDEILSSANEFYLPLKFKFGVEKTIVHEIKQDEPEVDNLFKELEFTLQACSIGADDTPMYEHEGDNENVLSNDAISRENLCAKGKHYLIHDDEIGVICKFCSYVYLEIKHVMPDFNKDPFGRGNRREYDRFPYEDKMARDGFQFPDSSYDRQGDYPSPSDDIQGTVWDLIPGVKSDLYPHQREGFEFIWKNVAGGIQIDKLGKPSAYGLGGCIICHAPGTGKTRLAIVFLQSFMKQYQMANPVIVAPCSMLRTWEEEFVRWKVDIPFFSLNENELSGKEDPKILNYAGDTKDEKTIRSIKLLTWASGKGVLGVSYTLLQRLAGEKESTDEKVREILLKKPGILVLDEGHTPRNEKSKIWRVLSQISTKRRVILSGTPFQNNFEELHNIIALVREEAGVPVLPGYYEQDDRRIVELRKRIKPFVHVHKGEILREKLKGLFHSLIILKPSSLQKTCFDHLAGIRLSCFAFDNLVSITSVHPSIFCHKNVKKPTFVDDAFKGLLKKHRMDLDAGVKTRFLVELIKLSKGERVLVFGQYIPPLMFIADLLKAVFCWTMGSELLYMQGKQDLKERQSTINLFNDPKSEARVLLASTRACSEGIHLVGASRVVLLDVVWNPSVERQAISRAYRLGQEKDVYVYHLITSDTLEEEKFQRQATKDRLSEIMFSSSEESMEKKSTRSRISEDCVLEEMILHEKMKHLFTKIIYQPKADNLIESFSMVS